LITDNVVLVTRVEVRHAPRVRTPWNDAYVLRQLRKIEAAPVDDERKYAALDQLYLQTANRHPHGFAADVMKTIARAMDKY
jgi:hypothetical protein